MESLGYKIGIVRDSLKREDYVTKSVWRELIHSTKRVEESPDSHIGTKRPPETILQSSMCSQI